MSTATIAAPRQIHVASWMTPAQAQAKYAETLSYTPEAIPPGYTGSVHMGEGVWRTVCRACGAFCDTFGSMPRYATIGPHEATEHDLEVAGINVGILGKGK